MSSAARKRSQAELGALEGVAPAGLEIATQAAFWRDYGRKSPVARGELHVVDGELGKTASRVSPPAAAAKPLSRTQRRKRADRFGLRHFGRDLSHHGLVSRCGHSLSRAGDVSLMRGADGRTFFSGLVRCGSVWECPVCSQAIAMGRGEELKQLLTRHRSYGGAAYMLTLTLPHDQGDALEPMRRHVSRGWQFMQSGAPWKRWKVKLGLVGTVRALELTHGANGWHPHLHVVICTTAPVPAELLEEFRRWVLERWRRAIARPVKGSTQRYRAPSDEHGVTLLSSHRDDYITKMGLADELAKGVFKSGAEGRRTPLRILHDAWRLEECCKAAARTESAPVFTEAQKRALVRDVAIWLEYADEMHGARQLTWSKGLRERYALEEQTDLELCAEEEKQPSVQLYTFAKTDWHSLISHDVQLQLALLDAGSPEWPPDVVNDSVLRLLDHARGLEPLPF